MGPALAVLAVTGCSLDEKSAEEQALEATYSGRVASDVVDLSAGGVWDEAFLELDLEVEKVPGKVVPSETRWSHALVLVFRGDGEPARIDLRRTERGRSRPDHLDERHDLVAAPDGTGVAWRGAWARSGSYGWVTAGPDPLGCEHVRVPEREDGGPEWSAAPLERDVLDLLLDPDRGRHEEDLSGRELADVVGYVAARPDDRDLALRLARTLLGRGIDAGHQPAPVRAAIRASAAAHAAVAGLYRAQLRTGEPGSAATHSALEALGGVAEPATQRALVAYLERGPERRSVDDAWRALTRTTVARETAPPEVEERLIAAVEGDAAPVALLALRCLEAVDSEPGWAAVERVARRPRDPRDDEPEEARWPDDLEALFALVDGVGAYHAVAPYAALALEGR